MSKKNILYITASLLLILAFVLSITINSKVSTRTESLQELDEVITDMDTGSIESTDTQEIPEETTEDTQELVRVASLQSNELTAYDVIEHEIEMIKAEDTDTIAKYFGNSEVFEPSIVADKLTATLVSFVSSTSLEDGKTEVILHVCTLDYHKMNDKMLELKQTITDDSQINIEIAKGVVNGEYDLHYTIPVVVENYQIHVTEELKEAITGGWYKGVGVNMDTVECPIN